MPPHDLADSEVAQLDALRAIFTDVTDALSDINPTDRVYRSAAGRMVKVRLSSIAQPDARQAFIASAWAISGSDCDAAGRAIPRGDSHRITPPHVLTRQASPGVMIPVDMALRFELERLKVAAMTEQAGAIADQTEHLA